MGAMSAAWLALSRIVTTTVPGIVFLSGGRSERVATAHLDVINKLDVPRPWNVSFSYGRALQDPALEAWHGKNENLRAGQQALCHRARCNSAASLGQYSEEMEGGLAVAGAPSLRDRWHDD